MKPGFILFFLTAFGSTALGTSIEFVGVAYKSEDKKTVAYREVHKVKLSGNRVLSSETNYMRLDGTKLARLACDYKKNRTVPDFEFEDFRTGYKEKVVLKDDLIHAEIREGGKDTVQKISVEDISKLAASQGLNEYIKERLLTLKEGKDVDARFLIPSRGSDVGMLISAEKLNEDKVRVSIRLKSIFLRIFAPRLDMEYSADDARLLKYYGRSNISTDDGKVQQVYIEYDYSDAFKVASNEKQMD